MPHVDIKISLVNFDYLQIAVGLLGMEEITDKLFGPHGLLKTINIADVLRQRRYHDAIRREIDQIRRKVCKTNIISFFHNDKFSIFFNHMEGYVLTLYFGIKVITKIIVFPLCYVHITSKANKNKGTFKK